MKKIFGFPFAVFKEKSSQIPHVYQPSGDFSFSSMSTNPFLSVVPSVILLLILRKLLFTVSKRQRRQKFSSFAHLLRPKKSLGKGGYQYKFVECFVSAVLRLLPDKYKDRKPSLL